MLNLNQISTCGGSRSKALLNECFPGTGSSSRVPAAWYTGELRLGKGEVLRSGTNVREYVSTREEIKVPNNYQSYYNNVWKVRKENDMPFGYGSKRMNY